MKLKETSEEVKEEIKEDIYTNSTSSDYDSKLDPIDISTGLNSNVTINQSNPEGLDGYYNPANQSVGNSGFYGNTAYGYNQPSVFDAPYEEPPKKLTKPEFIAREGNRKHRDRITISAIVIYVAAIIGIFAADFLVKTIESLNDYMVALGGEPYDTSGYMTSQILVSMIMIGLGVGIQMFKSRACALIGLAGSAINMIATFIAYHKLGGYYVFLAFCYATAATFTLANRWKEYEMTGKCHGVI